MTTENIETINVPTIDDQELTIPRIQNSKTEPLEELVSKPKRGRPRTIPYGPKPKPKPRGRPKKYPNGRPPRKVENPKKRGVKKGQKLVRKKILYNYSVKCSNKHIITGEAVSMQDLADKICLSRSVVNNIINRPDKASLYSHITIEKVF